MTQEAAEQKQKRGPIVLMVSLSDVIGGPFARMMRERFIRAEPMVSTAKQQGKTAWQTTEEIVLAAAKNGAVLYDKAGNTVEPQCIEDSTGKLVCLVKGKDGGTIREDKYFARELTPRDGCNMAPEARERGRSIDEASPQEWDRAAAAVRGEWPHAAEYYFCDSKEDAEALSGRLKPDRRIDPAAAKREQTIDAMCMTIRHDYGLPAIGEELWRKGLHRDMTQLYDHHIAPIVKDLEQTKELLRIEKVLHNRTKGLRDDFPSVTMYMNKPMDYWQGLEQLLADTSERLQRVSEARGEVQSEYRDLFWTVNAACKRLGIVEPKSNAEAIAAVKFMDELVTEANGVIAHIANRLGIGEQIGTMDRHGQYATIIGQVALLKAHPWQGIKDIRAIEAQELDRLLAIERGHMADKSTVSALEATVKAQREKLQSLAVEAALNLEKNTRLGERYDAVDKDLMEERYQRQEAEKKLTTLRNIVLRLAPHGHDCRPEPGTPCTCWKGAFLTEADKA